MCLIVWRKKWAENIKKLRSYQKRNLFFFSTWRNNRARTPKYVAMLREFYALLSLSLVLVDFLDSVPLQIVWIYCRYFTRFARLFSDFKVLGILFVPSRVLSLNACHCYFEWDFLCRAIFVVFYFMCKMQLWLNFDLIRMRCDCHSYRLLISMLEVNYGKWSMCRCSFVSFVWSFIIWIFYVVNLLKKHTHCHHWFFSYSISRSLHPKQSQ